MAATNINRVVLTGNLTADPELRNLPSGTSVCKLRVACNTRRKGASGEWEDKPNYFDVTVWGAQGENSARYLAKGRPVAIDGRLEWREWQDKDGNKRQSVDIVADSVQFLGGRDDTGGGGQSNGFTPRSDVPANTDDFQTVPSGGGNRRAGRRRHPVLGTSPPRLPVATGPGGQSDAICDLLDGPRSRSAERRAARNTRLSIGLCHNDGPARFARARLSKRLKDFGQWQSSATVASPRVDVTRRAAPAPAGASRARTARTRSSRSTTRTRPSCASSSPRRARSAPGGSPEHAVATRARSHARSSAPVSSRCCPTSTRVAATTPSARAVAAVAAVATRRLDAIRDPHAGRRAPRRAWSRRRRLQGLPAQLPDAAQARAAGDEGRARRGAPPFGGHRSGHRRRSSPRRRRTRSCSAAPC